MNPAAKNSIESSLRMGFNLGVDVHAVGLREQLVVAGADAPYVEISHNPGINDRDGKFMPKPSLATLLTALDELGVTLETTKPDEEIEVWMPKLQYVERENDTYLFRDLNSKHIKNPNPSGP